MKKTVFKNHTAVVGEGFALRRLWQSLVGRELAYSYYVESPEVGRCSDGTPKIYCLVIDYETMEASLPMIHWLSASDGLDFFQRHENELR